MPKTTPKSKTTAVKHVTLGFGVPASSDPHHFKVIIPKANNDNVEILEYLGMQAQSEELSIIERVIIERQRWAAIRAEVQRAFNVRLKEHGLKTSAWTLGENVVDRLLGKELCVLAWAVESMDVENIPVAIRNWLALRPEERWWLFGMTAASTGTKEDRDVGWRIALRHALGDIVQTSMQEPSASYDKGTLTSEKTREARAKLDFIVVDKKGVQDPVSKTDGSPKLKEKLLQQTMAKTNANSSSEETLFLFEAKQAKAAGHPIGDRSKPGFVVTKGSTANIQHAKSLRPAIKELRQELATRGILIEDGKVFSFTQEYTFKSPSAAACVIAGNPRSGMDAWRNMKGESLKDLGYGKK
ncbi:hypothetical protein AMEC673_10220 [Alteromonas macleodii str. 'English Channel 673']|uniref:DUF4357 domain-containing protein n=1 Tax=Alteromonas macleodii (strain English Channel 673) TaxID=1004788 RepID=A0AB32ZYP2_ALTME|nr:anti-phage-associated DUF3780 domain-containing protein [Alteromonas macleodii]AFT74738.1 hypothetical protein AMEC673_10220 [Alteromonas macleodii str. 'English Channel 673']